MTEEEFREKEAEKEQKKQENKHNAHNNAKALRVAATVAEHSGVPQAMIVGKVVNTADKLTGGKSTELLGGAVNKSLKHQPGGKKTQAALNKLGDSGITDAAGKVAAHSGKSPANNAESKNQNPDKNASKNQPPTKNNSKNNNSDIVNTTENIKNSEDNDEESNKAKMGCLLLTFISGITVFISMLPLLIVIICTVIILIIIIIIILFFTSLIFGSSSDNPEYISFENYYSPRCNEMTVIEVDSQNGYEVTGSQTYSMEDYVAGVVAAEIGSFKNKEVYKAYAIASRTYAQRNASDDCSIEGSARAQEFTDITNSSTETTNMIYEAVRETEGQVLMAGGELYRIQYDELYLSAEEGYSYDKILESYYGEDVITISSDSFIDSVAGLEIKDTTNADVLNEPITTFLNSKGSSLDDLNNFVYESVKQNGPGTREGVVTAAVSMINYLYDNFNTKLPYYWGGKVYSGAIPSSFGTYSPSEVSRGGGISYYKSFDCSGFVSWSIRNGGYNFTEQSTAGFDSNYSKNSCNILDSNCIGQPGDLINSSAGHVELIIAVDEINNKYFVAESGGPGVVMRQRDMHKGNSSKNMTKIIFMEEFYSNASNVNVNY